MLGKFKNELAGHVISERINLRSKLYAFKLAQSDESELRCKGVKKVVVKKTLELDHYREVLQTQTSISREQVQLRSYNHRVFTIRSNKTALSSYDDKRYILRDGVDTRAHGHWRNEHGDANHNQATVALRRCE